MKYQVLELGKMAMSKSSDNQVSQTSNRNADMEYFQYLSLALKTTSRKSHNMQNTKKSVLYILQSMTNKTSIINKFTTYIFR